MAIFAQAGCALGLATSLVLYATGAVRAAPMVSQTNLPHVTTVLTPSADFDPILASDAEIAANGLPPRPGKAASSGAFASWQRAVTSHAVRVLPVLRQTDIRHGPSRDRGITATTGLSGNWSGYVLLNGVTSYVPTSFDAILADYVVPAAQQAFGTCSSKLVYSSTWVGIDGEGSNDVLQAGTESDASCSGSTTQAYYDAWYEWAPDAEVVVNNFPVNSGDDIYVEVWSSGATTGHAYMIDYTSNQSFNVTFSAPAGTSLVGNSAEWIVERPTVGGSLSTLANYVQDFMSDAYVGDFGAHESQPGAPASGVASIPFQMVGDSASDILSYPAPLGINGIWFHDSGSAN